MDIGDMSNNMSRGYCDVIRMMTSSSIEGGPLLNDDDHAHDEDEGPFSRASSLLKY